MYVAPCKLNLWEAVDIFLTLTDGYSRYKTVQFLDSRAEVLSKFKEFATLVEKQTGHQTKKSNILPTENEQHDCENY